MYLFYLLFSIFLTQSKEIVIVDAQSKEPVSYTAIKFVNSNHGIYTNKNGVFDFSKVKSDSIEVFSVGYLSLKLKTSEIRDTIFLKQKSEVLNEVVINTGKSTNKTIGLSNKKKSLSWHIRPKTELVTLVKFEKKIKKSIIKKIHIPIGKKKVSFSDKGAKETFPAFNNVFRVNIYSNEKGKPNNLLIDRPILVECNQDSKDILEIDIEDEQINYNDDGIFIGVEMIGKLDSEKNVIESKGSILPSFMFTKRKKKNITSNSFIKVIFLGEDWVNITDNEEFNQVSKYNMAVGLTLKIYKN